MSRSFRMGPCIGKGGFGEVYRATMEAGDGPGRAVAVKLLREELGDNEQAVLRMRDEARLLRSLSHPNILETVGLTRLAGRVALITEYVEGADLSTCIEDGDVAPRAVLEIVARIARALDAAWTASPGGRGPLRLVHRDVKPSNIRVARDGRVKLLDFGIARSDEITRAAVTASDMLVGSPPYLAPERFLRGPPVPASDVYALGATAYEALTGERFANVALAVHAAHAVEPDLWSGLLERRLAVPGALRELPALRDWLASLLAHSPDDRPDAATCAQHAESLSRLVPGPDHVRWAQGRSWRSPRVVQGHLAGQVLVEDPIQSRITDVRPTLGPPSSIATVPATDSLERPPTPRRTGRGALIAAVAAGLGALSLALVTLGLAGALWGLAGPPRPILAEPAAPSPPAGPSAPVGPPPEPRAAIEPEPASESVAPPRADAGIATPEPSPAPRPVPTVLRAPRVSGRVRLDDRSSPVWLTGPDGARTDVGAAWSSVAPAEYVIHTSFDPSGAGRAIRSFRVQPGWKYTIRCAALTETCSVQ